MYLKNRWIWNSFAPFNGNFISYNIRFYIAGFRVEEETRCAISTLKTKAKKWWGCKTVTGWDSENKIPKGSILSLMKLVYLQNENQFALTINAILSRFNCNIRSSKNLSSLGYGRHRGKKKFFRYMRASLQNIFTLFVFIFTGLIYGCIKFQRYNCLKNLFSRNFG